MLLTYVCGGSSILEHPRGPSEGGDRWCAWHSAMVKRLELCAGICKVVCLQGLLGQPFTKPTFLLTGRLPHLPLALYSQYDPKWRPTMVLGGKDSSERFWKTSHAKAYPPKLCKIMAEQFLWFASTIQEEGVSAAPEGLGEALARLCCWDPYTMDDSMNQMKGDYDRNASSALPD